MLLGYSAGRVAGQKCYEVMAWVVEIGLTPDCIVGCVSVRYALAGMVPSPAVLEIRCASGELKRVEEITVPLRPVGLLGRVLVYLLEVSGGPDADVGRAGYCRRRRLAWGLSPTEWR